MYIYIYILLYKYNTLKYHLMEAKYTVYIYRYIYICVL